MKRIIAILLSALCGLFLFSACKTEKSKSYEIAYRLVIDGETKDEIPDYLKKDGGEYPTEYKAGNGDVQNAEIILTIDALADSYETSDGKIVFQGWYVDETCLAPFKGVSNITVGDLTLYGKYETERSKTITYRASVGGEQKDMTELPEQMLKGVSLPTYCEEWSDLQIGRLKNCEIKISDALRARYQFFGWYTDESCELPFDLSKVDGDSVTLYAKIEVDYWTKNY